jgi:DNA-binding response OmpR family regulator
MSTRYRDSAGQARFPTPRDAPELLIAPLTKPVDFVDLSALTEALTRSAAGAPDTELHVGSLEVDLIERTAKRGDRSIELSPREFLLLKYMRHKDRVAASEN